MSVGSRGEALEGGLGEKLKQSLFTDFDCRNDKNMKILHISFPDS